jgi:transposase
LDQIDERVTRVMADGAYGGAPIYAAIAAHGDDIEVVIPPRSTAVASGEQGPPKQRDCHLKMITEQGRLAWRKATDYGQRSLVETTMGRYKALIGPRLRARDFATQQTEAAISVAVQPRSSSEICIGSGSLAFRLDVIRRPSSRYRQAIGLLVA